jgi:type VI secretion system secreted protein VgrG
MATHLVVSFGDKVTLQNRDIERLEYVQELGSHDRARITFHRDTASRIAIHELAGEPCRVHVWDDVLGDDAANNVDFGGVVVDAEQQLQLDGGAIWIVEVCARTVFLDAERNLRVFPEMDLTTLARLVAPMVRTAGAPGTARTDYVQWGETDWAFLVRAADDAGCFVRGTPDGIEVRRGFQQEGPALTWGRNLLTLSVRATPRNNGAKGVASEVAKKEDYYFRDRRQEASFMGLPALVNTVNKLARDFPAPGDPVLLDHQSRAPTLGDFRERVMAESERAVGTAITVHGASVSPAVRAGSTATVSDGGGEGEGERFKLPYPVGEIGIVKVTHRWDGQEYRNEFLASPWVNFTSFEAPPRQRMHGVVSGECIDIEDPEQRGRVKVRLHFQGPDDPLLWMRMVVPYAGHERGIQFMPEVGDEVVVAFEEGDPARPYVLGAVWNGTDRVPDLAYKQIVTKSGNTIRLSDERGKEAIQIFTPDGACLLQLENGGGGSTVTIHSEGDISLEAKDEIRIKCRNLVQSVEQDYVRKAGNSEKAAVGSDLTLTSAQVSVAADANMTLSAGMNLDASAGVLHNVVGTLVHLNPPAFVKMPIMKAEPNLKASVWTGQPGARTVTRLKHTFDPVPPRGLDVPIGAPSGPASGNGAARGGAAALAVIGDDTTTTFIEIEMVDDKGHPVPNLAYVIEASDGTRYEGTLDADGRARVDDLEPGDCRITFPDLDKDAWADA